MFVFGLKKTQVGVTMALLVLGISICPHSGYPHVEENDDPTAAKENVDNEEEQELFLDEDQDLEDEQSVLEEAADVEDGPTREPKYCGSRGDLCGSGYDPYCEQLKCLQEMKAPKGSISFQYKCLPP